MTANKYLGYKTASQQAERCAQAGYSLLMMQHLYFICNGSYSAAD